MFGRGRARGLVGLAAAIVLVACSPSSQGSATTQSLEGREEPPAVGTSPPAASPIPSSGRVRIAFGGDVHFAGSAAAALNGNPGSAVKLLKQADLSIVNLETAITERGSPGPKEFTFRAPAKALDVLREAGIDVVTVANNHGMDYGPVGLEDTLAAGRRAGLPIIGAGQNTAQAYRPYRTTVNGVRIAVIGATDVLDTFAQTSWPATATRPGLASAKDTPRLVRAVRAARAQADVVVVDLHWGIEMESCPSARQQELAATLTGAGAQVVVGSHAHVLEPHVRQGRTTVHYGLGNFVFYATRPASVRSGVYDVVVDRNGVVKTKWHPAQIRSGRPALLTGSAARSADRAENELAEYCGLA